MKSAHEIYSAILVAQQNDRGVYEYIKEVQQEAFNEGRRAGLESVMSKAKEIEASHDIAYFGTSPTRGEYARYDAGGSEAAGYMLEYIEQEIAKLTPEAEGEQKNGNA